MNPKGQDIHWTPSGVVRRIDDVLEIKPHQHVFNHVGVVIDLTNAFRTIGNRLRGAGIVANKVGDTTSLQVTLALIG